MSFQLLPFDNYLTEDPKIKTLRLREHIRETLTEFQAHYIAEKLLGAFARSSTNSSGRGSAAGRSGGSNRARISNTADDQYGNPNNRNNPNNTTTAKYMHVQELDLSYRLDGRQEWVMCFIDQVVGTTHPSLRTVNLERTYLSDAHMECIANALIFNTSLLELHLNGNFLGDQGVTYLMQALHYNKTLKKLALMNNPNIGLKGLQAISSALEFVSLEELYLFRNFINDQGAIILAQGVAKNTSLKALFLDHNHIGDVGCQAIANSLKCNITLKVLHLGSNSLITNDGLSLLVESLEHPGNCMIEKVFLRSSNHDLHHTQLRNQRAALENRLEDICTINHKVSTAYEQLITCTYRQNGGGDTVQYDVHNKGDDEASIARIGISLWPRILCIFQSKPDLLFHILSTTPELVQDAR